MGSVVGALLATFLYGSFIGWVTHWIFHQRWAGFAHRAHMNHHLKQYPPDDLASDKYRSAGRDNSVFIFTPPIVLAFALFLGIFYRAGVAHWLLAVMAVETLVLGVAHDWLHTTFHLRETRLLDFEWYRWMRIAHFQHHRNMKKNLGIFWFGWDRVLGTFYDAKLRARR